jgi:branched-chain amino acid transport system ATP-binding protein
VIFEGKNITGKKPHSIAESGLVRTFQSTVLFKDFTVLENIMTACHLKPKFNFWAAALHSPASRKKQREALAQALEIVQLLGLDAVKNRPARSLPHGHMRILGIAMALAVEPKVLLLDEPLSGMNAEEVSNTMTLIERIWQRGVAILLIEHNMRVAMSLCERIVVLNFGRKIAEGSPEEIQANNDVIRAYLGDSTHVT